MGVLLSAQTGPAMQRHVHGPSRECGGDDIVQRALARVRRFRRSDFEVRLVPPLRECEGRRAQPRLSSSSSDVVLMMVCISTGCRTCRKGCIWERVAGCDRGLGPGGGTEGCFS